MVSKASELFPEPDRPVMTTSFSRGMSRSTPLRLCSRAPRTRMKLCFSVMESGNAGEAEQAPARQRYLGSNSPDSARTMGEHYGLPRVAADSRWQQDQPLASGDQASAGRR